MLSYLVPGLGEIIDAVWAPISAYFLHVFFGSIVITVMGLAEELGPGTDIIPTATLAWLYENCYHQIANVAGKKQGIFDKLRKFGKRA